MKNLFVVLFIEEGERMSTTFISDFVDSTYVPGNLIKIGGPNGTPIECLAGYEVEEYDLSKDSGRNAKGTMRLCYIGTKYKIIFKTRYIHQQELLNIYNNLPRTELSIYFFNPYTGTYQTIQCYRGDRKVSMKWDRLHIGKLYEPVSQSLIEL